MAALAAKLAALKDEYKADSALEKAGVDWGQRDALRWHLAQHGLLEPTHPTLLGRLGESVANAQAEAVFAVNGLTQTRIRNASLHWLRTREDAGRLACSYDIIAVRPWRWPEHFRDAF